MGLALMGLFRVGVKGLGERMVTLGVVARVGVGCLKACGSGVRGNTGMSVIRGGAESLP